MEQILGYIIFGVGWPVLIIGSIIMLRKLSDFPPTEKLFAHIIIVSFYVLGYVCTMFWLDQHWLVGVGPAFIAFLILFIVTFHTLYHRIESN